MFGRSSDGVSADRRRVAEVVASAARAAEGADGSSGLQESAVQDLYDATTRVVERQLESLRRLQVDADGRLRATVIEQQQLDRFLDEVSYQARFTSGLPGAASGALAARMRDIQTQELKLRDRQGDLKRMATRLEKLHSRISWLVRQIELSAARMNENGDQEEEDPWAMVMRAQVIQGQEAERSRLAREIHDGPAQALTNTLMRLRLVESMLARDPEMAARELSLLRASVQDSLADVRRSIFNLRPASLREVGVITTLERSLDEFRKQSRLEVAATLPERIELRPEQELSLFRIVQEALHNIHKHARATRVELTLSRQAGNWELVILDNGQGFDADQQKRKQAIGSGLAGMRERAVIGGGTLDLVSKPGYGTRLVMTLPVFEDERADR